MSPLHGEEQYGMKDAANELIDVVLNSNSDARIALVPFNNLCGCPMKTTITSIG